MQIMFCCSSSGPETYRGWKDWNNLQCLNNSMFIDLHTWALQLAHMVNRKWWRTQYVPSLFHLFHRTGIAGMLVNACEDSWPCPDLTLGVKSNASKQNPCLEHWTLYPLTEPHYSQAPYRVPKNTFERRRSGGLAKTECLLLKCSKQISMN